MSPTLILRLAWPDVLERVRRSGFLLAVGTTIWLGSLVYTQNIHMSMGDYRGVINSAWLGTVMALSATTFVSLAGFYMVKNTVARDRETGVGQVLAATRVSTRAYLLAKWLSNFAVLSTIVLILAVAAVVLHFVQADAVRLDLVALLSPLVLLALPAMAVIAAFAVVFETVPALSGGAGNVAYFFVCNAALAVPLVAHATWADWCGISYVETSLVAAVHAVAPGAVAGIAFSMGPAKDVTDLTVLNWTGIEWTPMAVLARLVWIPISAVVALGTAVWFDRFDSMSAGAVSRKRRRPSSKAVQPSRAAGAVVSVSTRIWDAASVLIAGRTRLGAMLAAELRLAFSGVSRWWMLVAAGVWLTSLLAPIDAARYAHVAAWGWPLLLWSNMGVREALHRTGPLVYSCPRPLQRQFIALWLSGVLIAIVTGSGLAIRFAATGDVVSLAAWIAGALFIPSLALALGVWTESSRAFEALYTTWWYVGPVSRFAAFDYSGASADAVTWSTSLVYLTLAAVMLAAAALGRRRQIDG
jgi:hypothetical protein